MKITIIGGGNMGGAIARGLTQGSLFQANDITVVDIIEAPLKTLSNFNNQIHTHLGDYSSIAFADIVLLAVKPWLILESIRNIKPYINEKQILASVAAGISIKEMSDELNKEDKKDILPAIFRVVPNTAVSVCKSMTLIASNNASAEQETLLLNIFNELGWAILIEENKIPAGTALTSCGIAYLFKYIRAAMLAGIEMGFYPQQAQDMIIKTMLGAGYLLNETKQHPEIEIDKVTTPGGITIKGINELEANGFTHSILQAMRVSNLSNTED
ncbi:pyrroline-5-carboxylate reductase [Bacteroidales bacterium OttesenSCG-928-M11]|nr:pyrroline-5-carboxylate reductase [Bacteroidales bacterium OttesenSCG-928-M11]